MSTVDLIRRAIELRLPVEFSYRNGKPYEPVGVRIGNPHALFYSTADWLDLDLYQTGGVKSYEDHRPIPGWRMFTVEHIVSVRVLENASPFADAPGYKPHSPRYGRCLAKV